MTKQKHIKKRIKLKQNMKYFDYKNKKTIREILKKSIIKIIN